MHGFMAGGRPSAIRLENLNHRLLPFPVKRLHSVDLDEPHICHVRVAFSVHVLHVKSRVSVRVGEYTRRMLSVGCVIICRYSMTPAAF